MRGLWTWLNNNIFFVTLVLLGVLGVFLRVFLLGGQIPLDDEWHEIFASAVYPSSYLVAHAPFFSTSPPLNIYQSILLHTVGWSELRLVFPSIVPGILALVVFPALVLKAHGKRIALIFFGFLAISPFLIFYSRVIGRPYSMQVFLLVLSVYSGGFWLLSNRLKYLLTHIFCSVLAVYFHPGSVATVFVPLVAGGACLFFRKPLERVSFVPKIQVSGAALLLVMVLMAIFSGIVLLPTLAIARGVMVANPLPTSETLRTVLILLFGTSQFSWTLVCLSFCLSGAVILFRRNIFFWMISILIFMLNILLVYIGRFDSTHVALVFTRYIIMLLPVCFLWTAIGLDQFVVLLQRVFAGSFPMFRKVCMMAVVVLVIAPLVVTSPLWVTYRPPNNFTNHSAFQETYESKNWSKPVSSRMFPVLNPYLSETYSPFYRSMPESVHCVIEYPMILADIFNPLYFFQQLHRKRVVVGYADEKMDMTSPPSDVGSFFVNHALRLVEDKSKLKFKNLVNIFDYAEVARTGADLLIIHRNLITELYPDAYSSGRGRTPNFKNCIIHLQTQYGAPIYEDQNITVFCISQ